MAAINVYPNPFQQAITVDLTGFETQSMNIELIDITGKLIKSVSTTGQSSIQLDAADLAKGMYQVRLSDGTQWYVTRIVKN